MTIEELILALCKLRSAHGKQTRVMINHTDAATPYFIPSEDGCLAYISLESE